MTKAAKADVEAYQSSVRDLWEAKLMLATGKKADVYKAAKLMGVARNTARRLMGNRGSEPGGAR